ncbi:MAG: TonB-dependent receptor [Nitrospirae bacterium]|nr:TonB-dependent receptor [Nitrospirota bacterium]
MTVRKISILLLSALYLLSFSVNALAISEEEKTFLSMYFRDEELVVLSATRSMKSIARVAENVTVVTSYDIELINAHTVADVLNTVNGVQMSLTGGPGSIANPLIQGSDLRHVAVLVDGHLINNLSDNIPGLGEMPVQNIEKIEIIKGPASSSWGSSLGGVVNIITKSGGRIDKLSGMVSASYGERNSGDFRAEAYGKKEKLGYYLYAGRLQTDGLTRGFDVSARYFYTKISYDFAGNTSMQFTLSYNKGIRGDGESSIDDYRDFDKFELLRTSLSLNTALSSEVDLSVSLRNARESNNFYENQISTGDELFNSSNTDEKSGASAKITWKHGIHSMVAGTDYDKGTWKNNTTSTGEATLRKWAIFANDTLILDKLSVTPGIRYDHSNRSGGYVSPSLGITYELLQHTLLRAYVARGFNAPSLALTSASSEYFGFKANPDLKSEKVMSYQLGAETAILKQLWFKVAAFRHDIKDVITTDSTEDPVFPYTNVNKGKQRRQGVEVEFKTVPMYNMTLSAGATYVRIKDLDADEEIKNMPSYTYDIGLQYDDKKSFRALFKGHYIYWNSTADYNAEYSSLIIDANMIKKLYQQSGTVIEAFLTAHNIFDGKQYWVDAYKNPGRWLEGGLRVKF